VLIGLFFKQRIADNDRVACLASDAVEEAFVTVG
jgi:hypothetical protein